MHFNGGLNSHLINSLSTDNTTEIWFKNGFRGGPCAASKLCCGGGLAHSFCKWMESKYFRLCGLYTGFVEYFLCYVLFSVFVKTTVSQGLYKSRPKLDSALG